MNRNFKVLTTVLAMGTMMYSGCAKKETVRPDAAPAAVASSAATPADAAPPPAAGATPSGPQQVVAEAAPSNAALTSGTADAAKGLDPIYFDFDSALLGDAARATLSTNFTRLKGNATARVRIEGHCDERGSDEYNLALSERRAQAAAQYLEALGIPAAQLSVIGYGEEKPADSSHDEAAWTRNRRDEFAVVE